MAYVDVGTIPGWDLGGKADVCQSRGPSHMGVLWESLPPATEVLGLPVETRMASAGVIKPWYVKLMLPAKEP